MSLEIMSGQRSLLRRSVGGARVPRWLSPVTATRAEEGRRGDPGATQAAVDDLLGRRVNGCGSAGVQILAVTLESAKASKPLVRIAIEQTSRREPYRFIERLDDSYLIEQRLGLNGPVSIFKQDVAIDP